ncbi:hypothetical protein [Rhizobium leguminosarum]|uniref:hypothetical protein n=1 Tax=Rhizobium leguminosarum TaxID=384 RepID=UPI003F9A87BA
MGYPIQIKEAHDGGKPIYNGNANAFKKAIQWRYALEFPANLTLAPGSPVGQSKERPIEATGYRDTAKPKETPWMKSNPDSKLLSQKGFQSKLQRVLKSTI